MNRIDSTTGKLRRGITLAFPVCLLAIGLTLVFSQVQRPAALVEVWLPWTEIGILALTMTAVILCGGIDLSVGSTVALCGVVLGITLQWEWPLAVALAATAACGLCAGAFNGGLVAIGMSPLVATLATMAFYRGLAMTLSGGQRFAGFPDSLRNWQTIAGFPLHFFCFVFIALAIWILIHRTRPGRWCYAIGDNRTAARFAAVPDRRLDLFLYTLNGSAAALVAILHAIDENVAIPDAFRGTELQVIACVVVGGTLITGGEGGVLRTLIGIGIVTHLEIGLRFMSYRFPLLTPNSRLVVIGLLVILVAIWNQRLQRGKAST